MTVLDDLRYAARGLRKSPGFSAVAVATLALGIGANTAIFSVVHAVLLKPLGFPQPGALVTLEERGADGQASNTGYPTYADWRARARSFEDVAVTSYWNPTLAPAAAGDAEKLEGLRISDGFFRMLGVRPALGRDFTPEEDRRGANRVVLLGHGLWQRRFGADPTLPGRTIQMGSGNYLVAGILPADFESVFSPYPGRPTEIWSPLGYDPSLPQACRTCRHLRAYGRLQQGVSQAAARAELDAVQAAIVREHPEDYASAGTFVSPLEQRVTGRARPALLTMLAAVAFVLLIGCANVASLLLARAMARRREVAIRTALGASRPRIARLFLTEALVLAAAGGLSGVVAAAWTLRALVSLAPSALPRIGDVRLDLTVLAFAAGVSLASGIAFGLIPALRYSRLDPEPHLREGSGASAGRRRRRAAGLLVAFDAALAFVLLFGASLLVKSTSRLLAVDPGFDPTGTLALEVTISGPVLGQAYSDANANAFYEQVLERLRGLPGVTQAAAVSQLPLGGSRDGFGVHIEGRAEPNPELAPDAERYSVTPDYLAVMRIPVRRGRGFTAADRNGAAPVVLINERLASTEFAGSDPIGRRFRIGSPTSPWRTIVGVVADVRHDGLDAAQTNQIYLPEAQFTDSDMTLVLRSTGDPAALAASARATIRAVDANQPVTHVETVRQIVTASAASRLFAARLSTAFAALAVLLSAVGVFGVVSGFVSGRVREIGIRLALGAGRGRILMLVSGQAVALAAAGVAAGVPVALGLGRALQSQLFQVSPQDTALLAAVAGLALAVALGASLLPARRATRISPMSALRSE